MATENQPVRPRILIQGRVLEIGISIAKADMVARRDGDDQPVVFTFNGRNGKFINIFDHRAATALAWAQYQLDKDQDKLDAVFASCPCLGRMAEKTARYIVLADIGTADMWEDGDEAELVLARGGEFNRTDFMVIDEAIHPATGICFIAPRPSKTEKEEIASADDVDAPVNSTMAAALANIKLAK